MMSMGVGHVCSGVYSETSREIQVHSLIETAKDAGIEVTQDLFELVLKRVYGGSEDAITSLGQALTSAMGIYGNKSESE